MSLLIQVLVKHMDDFYGDPFDFRPSSVSDIRLGSGRTKSVSYQRFGGFYNGGYDYLATFRMEDSGITCEDTEVEIVGLYNFASNAEAFKAMAPIVPQDCGDSSCHP